MWPEDLLCVEKTEFQRITLCDTDIYFVWIEERFTLCGTEIYFVWIKEESLCVIQRSTLCR